MCLACAFHIYKSIRVDIFISILIIIYLFTKIGFDGLNTRVWNYDLIFNRTVMRP